MTVKDVLQDFGEVLIFYDNNDFNVYINIYLANKPK